MGATPVLIAERYRIGHLLGQGGMAEVFAAHDADTGEWVAVKLLRQSLYDEPLDRRLIQELLAAARVRHPNLVAVRDFGVTADSRRPFFVMELLQGADLGSHLANNGPCPAVCLLPMACAMLDGLDAVHRSGIVHKDIKPANVFLEQLPGAVPRLRLTDFGIAHHMQQGRITQKDTLVCTPRYCAPEYIASGQILPASDVYQMGLVLAEALLGWPMVAQGDFVTLAFAHTNGHLQFPRGLTASPIGEVLARALAREPHHRYPHAGAFMDALTHLDIPAAQAAIDLHTALYRRRVVAQGH